ncbi:MAG TPA: molybdopterin-dependent oxidoreductase [Chloroflexota bacterium]|nr:molybdopterin-dependent oxidoreductase [Chloroflexota bacterium]
MTTNDPLHPHTHDPNPQPPSNDTTFKLIIEENTHTITLSNLQQLPATTIPNCFIVSTGHGTTGPFTFSGVTLHDFAQIYIPGPWSHLEIVSGDGFGCRVWAHEAKETLLAWGIDGRALTRQEGCVRLIVPSERDDALRQVKWVAKIRVQP